MMIPGLFDRDNSTYLIKNSEVIRAYCNYVAYLKRQDHWGDLFII